MHVNVTYLSFFQQKCYFRKGGIIMRMYSGKQLDMIAFPMGGIGAGTICFQGTGSLGGVAIRNTPNYTNDPMILSAITIKGDENVSRIIEAPVPGMKALAHYEQSGLGLPGRTFGLPRFGSGAFSARFPFADLSLSDSRMPVDAHITAWSPFVPGDEDASSLPFAALEYTFVNKTGKPLETVFYFASENFMKTNKAASVRAVENGFCLEQPADENDPTAVGSFCASVDREAFVDTAWIRGGWSFDVLTSVWKNITGGVCENKAHNDDFGMNSPGAMLAVPIRIAPYGRETVVLRLCWYVPNSGVREGIPKEVLESGAYVDDYHPWYSGRYTGVDEVSADWKARYDVLRQRTARFTECFFDTDLPEEIPEAVAANLSILKSTTVLRQTDGRFWGWEGCQDFRGSCHGSCTHVWNYQQALCNLFPRLERSLRETEFFVSQNEAGHQNFRSALPIQPTTHTFHAASDGQLGGIVKFYRDWRISGDNAWLKAAWPKLKDSLDYCIQVWDPDREGVLRKTHHNTYDIEFWGADGMCTSFYLAALKAFCEMGRTLGKDTAAYEALFHRGRAYMEEKLYNGEYFYQQVEWGGIEDLERMDANALNKDAYSPEVRALLMKEGPRYQYGTGCISDGVLGIWLGEVSGLTDLIDEQKLLKNLESIYKYNFKRDLSAHANPQRPGYAINNEGGLLLCTWPHGNKPSLPFVYSDEVWTGIEYQVASHLIAKGYLQEGLEIVRTLRARYDGTIRNPFSEIECGHWYARAMASYALIQAYTGVRYDAVEKTLYVSTKNSDHFRSFLSTNTGYGTVTVKDGKVAFEAVEGTVDIQKIVWSK